MARRLPILIAPLLALLWWAAPAAAQDLTTIGQEAGSTGAYLDYEPTAAEQAAIDQVNAAGVAFVWLDSGDDAQFVAEGTLADVIDASGGRYRTVTVLTSAGTYTYSESSNDAGAAGDASFDLFRNGDIAGGLNAVADVMSGSSSSSSGSGGGLPGWLWAIPAAIAGWFGFNWFRSKRKTAKAEEDEVARDKAEIGEQLRNNADRVIELGDRVIASHDPELQRLYEQASTTYQDVSQSLEGTHSAAEIDRLDERIDEAEWQFEVIEARLNNQPDPPSPAEREAAAAAEAAASSPADPSAGPALAPDRSIVTGSSRSGGYVPPAPRRRGGVGGVLGPIILGSGGIPAGSRRSRRRRNTGFGTIGSSSRRPTRRSSGRRRGSGGGGSFGSRGSGGGGRF